MRNQWIVGAAMLALTLPARGQSLADRIAQAPNGTVVIEFAARPGVCGNGDNVTINRSDREWSRGWCEPGPVRVLLAKDRGEITRFKTTVGGSRRRDFGAPVTNLGAVASREAATWLLDLAGRGGRLGDDAIGAAALADGVVLWPTLLTLARNDRLPRSTRRAAIFWVSQEAAEAAVKGLADLVDADDQDRDVRKHAVFALSQLPEDQGVPILIRTARTNKDPEIRKQAMFWLGQVDDPRALAYFEEVLTRGH